MHALHPKGTSSFRTAHVIILLLLTSVISGCFNSSQSDTNITKPKEFKKEVNSHLPTNPITQISLSSASLELAEGNTSVLHVNATYQNTTTQTLTSNLQWIITNPKIIAIQNQTLKALKEGETTLKARYQNLTSKSLHVRVYKEIHGHRLPPEPDKTLNDSTLLGIDSNNNGVRDDVERYLLEKYKDYHPIVSEIALQTGRAYQIILADPSKAKETVKIFHAAKSCNRYFKSSAKSYGDPILIDHKISNEELKNLQLNTNERVKAYLEYNHYLSGGVYRMIGGLERKAQCDFNVTQLLENSK